MNLIFYYRNINRSKQFINLFDNISKILSLAQIKNTIINIFKINK
jgi:hypothetical protein